MTASLIELGEMLLATAQQRLTTVSRNIANLTTPGYRAAISFQAIIDQTWRKESPLSVETNFEPGALQATGRSLDLALSGPGFFMLRGDANTYFTRSGRFERAADGRLINAQGLVLQDSEGSDVIIGARPPEILSDGVVLDGGTPVARIGVFDPGDNLATSGGTLFTADPVDVGDVAAPIIRQGMLETANVEAAHEMTEMMGALRTAEVAARIVQTYDGLMEQSINTWGRAAR